MIVITLNNIKNLNNSLQVGDMIYATSTTQQVSGVTDFENQSTGINKLVGILRQITKEDNDITLDVDDSLFINPYVPSENDFLMFSKYNQMDGDVNGYYAEATFKNNSKIKAELFSVGSEITINSK
tara:strand:- start:517 stop:894 length:378 start_codon:yes stop_codon:yes gene_type:complete